LLTEHIGISLQVKIGESVSVENDVLDLTQVISHTLLPNIKSKSSHEQFLTISSSTTFIKLKKKKIPNNIMMSIHNLVFRLDYFSFFDFPIAINPTVPVSRYNHITSHHIRLLEVVKRN